MGLQQSPGDPPEAILVYGSPGSGKSKGWADLARYYRQTGTSGHFHVLSTETGTVERISQGYPPSEADPGFYDNVTSYYTRDWLELVTATDKIVETAGPGDWVVIDELSSPWAWIRKLWEVTRPDYTPIDPLDPFAVDKETKYDWDKVKGAYYHWLTPIIQGPAHLYAAAHEDVLRVEGGWKDSDETIAMFRYIGMKAVTEKTAPYSVHTVLWARRTGPRQWAYTTVDDPERDYLTDTSVADFCLTYLLGPGRWTLS